MKQEFINDARAPSGLSLYSCGRRDSEEPLCFSERAAAHYMLCLISDGAGEVTADGRTFLAAKGEVFLVRPGVRVSCEPDSDTPWTVLYMEFDGGDAEIYLDEAGFPEGEIVKRASGKGIASAVMSCLDFNGENVPTQSKLTSLLLGAIGALGAKSGEKRRADPDIQVKKAVSFIEHNYMRGITAGDAALHLNIDRTHFFRIFKARTGLSPEKYIMKCRIDNARRMLGEGDSSVTETALAVGIRDVYYFSKFFKKNTGMSPSEYRKRCKNGVLNSEAMQNAENNTP